MEQNINIIILESKGGENNMTNFERIKNMPIDELAEELYKEDCNSCPCDKYDYMECFKDDTDCLGLVKKWLEMEC